MTKDIEIVYEDEFILAINKPVDLVVNRSNTNSEYTVQDWIEKTFNFVEKYKSDDYEEFTSRSGLCHRLDKDTSGVLVISKDPQTLSRLLKQFKSREISKQYAALVHGSVSESVVEIDAPIGRNPGKFMKFAVVSSGKNAYTRVEKVKEIEIDGNKYTLVNVFPKTGRTHQIRVHLAALGNYVVGDGVYCPNNLLEIGLKAFGRMMLHAHKLSFKHPESQEDVTVEAKKPVEFAL